MQSDRQDRRRPADSAASQEALVAQATAAEQPRRQLDVPARLSARVRVLDGVLDVGPGRKTDATDAHAVVMAALRDRDQLRELSTTEDLVVLRLLADRARRVIPVPRAGAEPAEPAAPADDRAGSRWD